MIFFRLPAPRRSNLFNIRIAELLFIGKILARVYQKSQTHQAECREYYA